MPVAYSPLPPDQAHAVEGVDCHPVAAHVRKPGRLDFMVVRLAPGSVVGGVFTQSRFAAAPVHVCREHLAQSAAVEALVINTGVANAATGAIGLDNARATCRHVADAFGLRAERVLPFSTGVILEHLPMERIAEGVRLAHAAAGRGERAPWDRAARAIMTTDTVYKLASRRIVLGGKTINVTGIAKGAGMIQPNMATMLGFVFTDAAVSGSAIQALARDAANGSFNRVTVDGDTSTNDSFVIAATARAGNPVLTEFEIGDGALFADTVRAVSLELAQAIVRDGEGATKFMTIRVTGGRADAECDRIARAIAHSPLVKTAFFASDPNLGRILAAVGYGAPTDLDPTRVTVHLNGVLVAEHGGRAASYREEAGAAAMKAHDIEVHVDLARGRAEAVVYTCDFSYDYVRINADYRS